MRQLIEEARRLTRIKSVSRDGNEEVANTLIGLMEGRGLKVSLQQVTHSLEDVSRRQFNAIGILGDPLVDRKTRKGLLLAFPTDTALPGILENWTDTQGDPFSGVLSEGKIHGVGASGSKLDMLCAISAIEKFRERKLKMPVYLVGLCGHENGHFGARYLIKSLAVNPKYTLVAGQTNLVPCYSTKTQVTYRVFLGYQVVERDAKGFNRRVDLHSFGRMAHSAFPDAGLNAIGQLVSFLQLALQNGFDLRFTTFRGGEAKNSVPDRAMAEFFLNAQQLEDFKRFFRETVKLQGTERAFRVELGGLGDTGIRFMPEGVFRSVYAVTEEFRALAGRLKEKTTPGFLPEYSTVNLSSLRHLASGVELIFDLRLTPSVTITELDTELNQALARVAQLTPSMNLSLSKDTVIGALGMTLDRDFPKQMHKVLEKCGMPVSFGLSSHASEASAFYDAGYEALVQGPGVPEAAHTPNEGIEIERLERAYHFYEQLIEQVCL